MKKIVLIGLAVIMLIFSSCKKESNSNGGNNFSSVIENIAGAYDIQHAFSQTPFGWNTSFGLESLGISRDSLLFIDRVSDNVIKTYGFFNTKGVVQNDRIQFDSVYCNGCYYPLGGQTDVIVSAKFENAYYSNGVINLNLRIFTYRVEDNSLFEEYGSKIIAIKH